jgi:hypothetical protein
MSFCYILLNSTVEDRRSWCIAQKILIPVFSSHIYLNKNLRYQEKLLFIYIVHTYTRNSQL